MRNPLALILVVAATFGCADTTGPTNDADALLVTDRASYTLERLERGLRTEIGLTYSNRTGRAVHLQHCVGFVSASLEKFVNGAWVHAWNAIEAPLCLGTPMVVPAGDVFRFDMEVHGFEEGEGASPSFKVDELEGTYRLFWHQARWEGEDRLPDVYRISNTFRVTVGT